jgi:hypothetical protein
VPSLAYTTIPDTKPSLTRKLFDYFSHRLDREVYARDLTAEFAEKVRPRWEKGHDFYRALGPPLGMERVHRDTDDEANSYRYRVRYGETALIVVATVDGKGRIKNLRATEE